MNDLIKNIGFDQPETLKNILKLHVPGGKIECDPTYSTGAFYNETGIDRPRLKFDIAPQADGVVKADARNLPIGNNCLSCMILDPLFLATKGKSLQTGSGNRINRRFSVFSNEKTLHRCYEVMLREACRVLKQNGILIFKCQDKVSSGIQYMTHVFVMNTAVNIGFYPRDLFILLSKNRIVANWQMKNQKHARKFNAYFWVFQKTEKGVKYI
jgi:hypothetical protein